jgi:hypothetical protein
MILLVLVAFSTQAPPDNPPGRKISLKSDSSKSISVDSESRVIIFVTVDYNGTCNVSFFSGDSPLYTVAISSEFRTFSGEKILVETGDRPASVYIWTIPPQFCADVVYTVFPDGELVGDVSSTVLRRPTCLFSIPFAKKHHLVSNVVFESDSPDVSVDYFVHDLDRPYSSCDKGSECVFWHTRAFLLRISGEDKAKFTMSLKYQIAPHSHQASRCFFGAIPPFNLSIKEESDKFHYVCESRRQLMSDEFKMIFRLVLVVALTVIVLQLCGCVDLCSLLGHREDARFAKIKVELLSGHGESI